MSIYETRSRTKGRQGGAIIYAPSLHAAREAFLAAEKFLPPDSEIYFVGEIIEGTTFVKVNNRYIINGREYA